MIPSEIKQNCIIKLTDKSMCSLRIPSVDNSILNAEEFIYMMNLYFADNVDTEMQIMGSVDNCILTSSDGVEFVYACAGGIVLDLRVDYLKYFSLISYDDTDTNETSKISLRSFFQAASLVKPHSMESIVLHMASEVGEVSECLVQPERNGDIVEESVDVILCALDVIYTQLSGCKTNSEITEIVNKLVAEKSNKWYNTHKKQNNFCEDCIMLVYRVELGFSHMDSFGGWNTHDGPYRGWFTSETLDWLESIDAGTIFNPDVDPSKHPTPRKDPRLLRNVCNVRNKPLDQFDACDIIGLYFGFGSVQKLSRWFDKWERQCLENAGYVCMVYDSEFVIPGSKQSVFDMSRSTPVRVIRLTDIYSAL